MDRLIVKGSIRPVRDVNQGVKAPGLLARSPINSLLLPFLLAETFLIQLPVRTILLVVLPWFTRLHPKWSIGRNLFISILKHYSYYRRILGLTSGVVDKSTLPRISAKHGATAIWIAPIHRQTGLTGEMHDMFQAGGCSTTRVPAYWYGRNHVGKGGYEAKKDERVILFFHGGGYREYNALPSSPPTNNLKVALAGAAKARKPNAPSRALAVEYRLTGESSFPSIFADALASWIYLVRQQRFEPKNIVLLGDSAGANLALALLRYIRDERPLWDELGLPRDSPIADSVILSSPWIDVSASYFNAGPSSSGARFAGYDHLTKFSIERAGLHLVRGLPVTSLYSKWISPVTAERDLEEDLFDHFPRALLLYGGVECFVDEIQAFIAQYQRANAGPLQIHVEPYAVHDYIALPLTFKAEHARARDVIAKWI